MSRPISTKIFIFFTVLASLWLFAGVGLSILLPFLLAAFLALSAEGAVSWLSGRLKLPRAVASFLGVSGVFLLLLTLVVLALAGLMRQLPRLSGYLPQLEAAVVSGRNLLQDWLLGLAGRLPGSIGKLMSEVTEGFFSQSSRMMEPIMQKLPQLATNLVGKMSSGIFGTVTGLIASFMLSVRLPRLRAWLKDTLPESLQTRAAATVQGLKRSLGGWGLAQLKLAGVTFLVLGSGFFLLRIRGALLWAFLITLVDAFPILGVGTVLVPWALVSLLQGNLPLGLGLLAVFAVAWVLRSVLEPRLVGRGLGLDPLVTLLAIYGGFKLWGIAGMLLAPILAITAVQVSKALRGPAEGPIVQKNQG